MTVRKMMIGWLAIAVPFCLSAEQKGSPDAKVTISDKDITVISFEELKYPFLDQHKPPESEGVVVVRAQLDEKGRVLNAAAISGKESLIPDSLGEREKMAVPTKCCQGCGGRVQLPARKRRMQI